MAEVTPELKIYTGVNAGTESPVGDATNLNLMSIDAYDATGTSYTVNKMSIPSSGTNYSFERWAKVKFNGTFSAVENVKIWKSAGTLSDANLVLNLGKNSVGVTPKNTVSTIAITSIPTVEASALDITPSAGISADGEKTDFFVLQLVIPSTATTPGEIGAQTLILQYDLS